MLRSRQRLSRFFALILMVSSVLAACTGETPVVTFAPTSTPQPGVATPVPGQITPTSGTVEPTQDRMIYKDTAAPGRRRAQDLVPRLTLDEKIGQMTLVDRQYLKSEDDIAKYMLGGLMSGGDSPEPGDKPSDWADMVDRYQDQALKTRMAIPLLYGIDAVHGHNKVKGATIFPHNIGLGATRSITVMQEMGRITAAEVAGTGINWTFGPCLCVARDEHWGRTYESFGEYPEMAVIGASLIAGLQGGDELGLIKPAIMATAKHWVGDGGTTGGVDQGNTELSEEELRRVHIPPFRPAITDWQVGSVMASFSSWNGEKVHGSNYLIEGVLKNDLDHLGFVVSDWEGIDQLPGDYPTQIRTAINAGIDMVMVPDRYEEFIAGLKAEIQAGRISMERIDDAVRRILTTKFQLGLFENPKSDRSLTPKIGSPEHREVARRAVQQSLVLLKNEGNILPLSKSMGKIYVAGKNADDIGNQSGGWTITWQGSSGDITEGTTILEGIKATVSAQTEVAYDRRAETIDGSYDVAVVVIGETPYAEFRGDRKPLTLDDEDLQTLERVKASGVPMVVVMVSGRPLIITEQLPSWRAFVAAWLPGSEGQGVADVLFGDYKPTGKLPITWPRSDEHIPINITDPDYDAKNPLFRFDFGLSY